MSMRMRVGLALASSVIAAALTLGAAGAWKALLWQEDGVAVCDEADDQPSDGNDYQMVADGSGGAIIVWEDGRDFYDGIYAQRLNPDGHALWQMDGMTVAVHEYNERNPTVSPDGMGGAFFAWNQSPAGDTDVRAQRLDASGSELWMTDGVTVCEAGGHQSQPAMTTDGAGGVIVAWYDTRNELSTDWDIYAQRLDASGNMLWDTAGMTVCAAPQKQLFPDIISDGLEGAIITWEDRRNLSTTGYDIYVQRLDGDGNALWHADGMTVCAAADDQKADAMVPDGTGGVIFIWDDERNDATTGWDIYAQRVDGSGNVQWLTDGITVCDLARDQYHAQIAPDGSGGAIATWTDNRTGNDPTEIYAQRLDSNGNSLWQADGISVCVATNDQSTPQVAAYWTGGAVIAWVDSRTGSGAEHYDIYAQRVDADGNLMWPTDGFSLCTASGQQGWLSVVSGDDWGTIVAWVDKRDEGTSGIDIYAQGIIGAAEVNLPLVLRKY